MDGWDGRTVDDIALQLAFRDSRMVELLDVAMYSLLKLVRWRLVQGWSNCVGLERIGGIGGIGWDWGR